ncbi:hypothetical protein HGO38_20105 [Rhizobium sp. CG5]|uniref:hypothetical protein n=1 Tax=Rhizobium sp. CG5 TaxID=2726076 RepID=UPI0020339413|nr:hypothetical protein [Rhizobium sp. CG5]MCM2475782.1 hypothetical protein [Rhizobium sp. CG5]
MKGLGGKFRLSRKLILISGGVLVLLGGTGAAAVFIGTEAILGPPYEKINGLECTEVTSVTIKKKDRFWVRKFVTTEPTDGLTRVKTALRVAKAVQEAEKADLVQVVVLDAKGPVKRADMRGRAVGADVIYVPDPSKIPEEANGQIFTARYVEKPANGSGQFYGEKISMTSDDIDHLVASLDDTANCVKPEVALPEGHGAPSGHGEAPAGHGEAPAGHGEAPAEGHGEAPAGHGDAPADGHGDAPASDEIASAEGHGEAPAADGHGAAPAETGGWFASLKGMVFGADEAPAAEGHEATPAAEGHDAAPAAEGHGEVAADHGAAPSHEAAAEPAAGHGEHAATEEAAASAAAHGAETAAAGEHSTEEATAPSQEPVVEADNGGWLSSVKSMMFGSGEDAAAPAEAQGEAAAAPEHASPEEPVPPVSKEHVAATH